jgi:hypothetical protein
MNKKNVAPKSKPSEHTPGPWKVVFDNFGRPLEIDTVDQSDAGYNHMTNSLPLYGRNGAPTHTNGVSGAAMADAYLMAAAPELLEALNNLLAYFSEYESDYGEDKEGGIPEFNAARAASRKAIGGRSPRL